LYQENLNFLKIDIFTIDIFLDAHPLYKYLKLKIDGNNDTPIKWNFAKFLVDRNGIPIKKYPSAIDPKAIKEDIKKLLYRNHSVIRDEYFKRIRSFFGF